jgi:hypothetical protein
MVIVFALDPRFAGNGFLREIKICSNTSFGGEVKPSALCGKILWHIKDPLKYDNLISKIQLPFLSRFLPASLLGVSAAARAENFVDESEIIRSQKVSTIYQKMVAVARNALYYITQLL